MAAEVAQQKKMLVQQQKDMKSGKDQLDVNSLFSKQAKKKAPEVKKPTKEEIENAKIVKQQKAMLVQQKAAMSAAKKRKGTYTDAVATLSSHPGRSHRKRSHLTPIQLARLQTRSRQRHARKDEHGVTTPQAEIATIQE